MPYDFFCPSLQQDLEKRTCKHCGLYFTSQKCTLEHEKRVHGKASAVPIKKRPQRIAARRANELLCIIRNQEATSEDAEWINESDVELTDTTVPETSSSSPNIPVKTTAEWLNTPWTIDD